MHMRTFVIGDIHGGLRALEALLASIKPGEEDLLIFLGDYVDGWSQAAETVDYLIALKNRIPCRLLRGNHDALCLQWLTEGTAHPLWLQSGGQATRESYEGVETHIRNEHIRFFESLENYYLDEANRLFLHAGFTNLKGVTHEYFSQNFYWDRTLWETALALDPGLQTDDSRYPSRLRQYREIYLGHTPVTRLGYSEPHRAANIWNMDTGAGFRGALSAMEITTKKIWQSEPVFEYYPGERGRN